VSSGEPYTGREGFERQVWDPFLDPRQERRGTLECCLVKRYEREHVVTRHYPRGVIAPREAIGTLGDHAMPSNVDDVQFEGAHEFEFPELQYQAEQSPIIGISFVKSCLSDGVISEDEEFRPLEILECNPLLHGFYKIPELPKVRRGRCINPPPETMSKPGDSI